MSLFFPATGYWQGLGYTLLKRDYRKKGRGDLFRKG